MEKKGRWWWLRVVLPVGVSRCRGCCDLGINMVLLDEIRVGKVVSRVTSGSASEGSNGSGSAGGGALRLDLVQAMVG